VIDRILEFTGKPASLIEYVKDRPGHDRRYALSSEKLNKETGWSPQIDFEPGLAATVDWYRSNRDWVQHVRSGEYLTYYARNYDNRSHELSGISAP
jgi:dTDP-glucose 4,6-dehydratase